TRLRRFFLVVTEKNVSNYNLYLEIAVNPPVLQLYWGTATIGGMMFQDLRYGARMLLKNPGFTVVVILSLALAIGANTAMFSYVDAVLLKPIAFKDPDHLVMVWELYQDGGKAPPSSVAFLEWRTQTQTFSHLSAITSSASSLNLTGPDRTERIRGSFVSANYF